MILRSYVVRRTPIGYEQMCSFFYLKATGEKQNYNESRLCGNAKNIAAEKVFDAVRRRATIIRQVLLEE